MEIPEILTQGATRVWKDPILYDDFNNPLTSDVWTLTYFIIGNAAVNGVYGLTLAAVPDGEGFQTTITTAQAANLNGEYTWTAYVQKGSDATTRFVVGSGELTVLQDLTLINPATTGYDGRTLFEKIVAQIDTAVLAVVTAQQAGLQVVEYTIGSRTVKKQPSDTAIKSLKDLRADYSRLLVRERQQAAIKNGEGDPRTVTARFRSPW